MTSRVIFACVLFTFLYTWEVEAHGKLMDPVSRSSAWRKEFKTPINYNDNELFCGGFSVQYSKNKGKCGPCGDDWSKPQPRANENGGIYGTGVIVERYKAGQKIELTVDISANHKGYFEFSLCPLSSPTDIESEECFNSHPIYLADGSRRYPVKTGRTGKYYIKARLPEKFKCPHCVLRWHYYCGNNWGTCEDGTGKVGCGPQEVFRGCADITIV